ncbi:HU family DNA-binding protein [Variovorax boronicumulans]|uniref:HU family DNA-binding protein n=1 Tax=Variovorax boronicumulans TaxID=436515 RepID=UPI00358E1F1B
MDCNGNCGTDGWGIVHSVHTRQGIDQIIGQLALAVPRAAIRVRYVARAARTGFNPKAGTAIKIAAQKVPKFVPGAAFTATVDPKAAKPAPRRLLQIRSKHRAAMRKRAGGRSVSLCFAGSFAGAIEARQAAPSDERCALVVTLAAGQGAHGLRINALELPHGLRHRPACHCSTTWPGRVRSSCPGRCFGCPSLLAPVCRAFASRGHR